MMYLPFLFLLITTFYVVESFVPETIKVPRLLSATSTVLWSTANERGDTAPPSSGTIPKVHNLQSLDDFLNYIDLAPQDSLAVVKFYAKSCPLCKRIELKYKKMARFYQTAPIQFAEIEKTAHPELFPTLGVETYPFIQIYRNGQCVAAHGTESDKTFEPMVHDTIQRELTMTSDDWNAFLTAFEAPIRASTAKLDSLRVRQTSSAQ